MSDDTPEFTKEIHTDDLCDMLGGVYIPHNNSCLFLQEQEGLVQSIASRPRYFLYYILQIFIGTSISFFGVFFGVTIVPVYWYINVIFLFVAMCAFVFTNWFIEGDVLESVLRVAVVTVGYVVVGFVVVTIIEFGTIFNGTYLNPFAYLTSDPIIAVIMSLFAGALLNVFLLPISEVQQVEQQQVKKLKSKPKKKKK
jgi:hypothetical protein